MANKNAKQRSDALARYLQSAAKAAPSVSDAFVQRVIAGGGVQVKAPSTAADRQLANRAAQGVVDGTEQANALANRMAAKKNAPHKNTVKGQERSLSDGLSIESFVGPQQPTVPEGGRS
jgi:hypothetical protein